MLNTQAFKLAAPGCGIMIYRTTERANALQVILSMRSSVVGAGLGLTGGGFVECGPLSQKPTGTISDTLTEAYRENGEENKGFEAVISTKQLASDGQIIASYAVRAPVTRTDPNGVHQCTNIALRITDDVQWNEIMALEGNEERVGSLRTAVLEWDSERPIDRLNPAKNIMFRFGPDALGEFHHKHELYGYGQLAWHAQNGRLW